MLNTINSDENRVVSFFLYDGKWVVASKGQDENWLWVSIPPVRIIPFGEYSSLVRTLCGILAEPPTRNLPVDYDDEVGPEARAVGARSWAAFARKSRYFVLQLQGNASLEEWPRVSKSFAPPPCWRIEFPVSKIESALKKLFKYVES